MDADISIATFWNSSPMELLDMLASDQRKKKDRLKYEAEMHFFQAELISRYIAGMFPQKGGAQWEPPHPWEYFPSLFEKEEKEYLQRQAMVDEEDMRESRRAYAEAHNKKRHAAQDG